LKIKVDENLGSRSAEILREAGHDAATVFEQAHSGVGDRSLIDHCRVEGRALITLDLDFANPFVFRPAEYPGIAVLRLPRRASRAHLHRAVRALTRALATDSIDGMLWIIETHRVRVYRPESDESD